MNLHKLLLAALLASAFAPSHAEQAEAAPVAVERRLVLAQGKHPMMAGHGAFMTRARTIKNAPYSAEVVTERVQTLGDGNQITRSTSAMSYRDSAGRVRHEVRDQQGELNTITIQDPVEKVTWLLHPKEKTATRIVRGEAREGAEGKLNTAERRTTPHGEEIVIRRVERAGASDPAAAREARSQLGPVLSNAFGDAGFAAKAVTKDLGTREFDGIMAQGKQRSYDIPAGAIGNRNAIVVVDETWTSPELHIGVYTRHSDPRSGEFVYRLHNLKREEPAPALFAVPSDYTVKDVLANIQRKRAEKAR